MRVNVWRRRRRWLVLAGGADGHDTVQGRFAWAWLCVKCKPLDASFG